MRESRIALCPESIAGVLPYRFFEAMSAGRVPLLVSSHYALPFADEIPYDEFILRCPAERAIEAQYIAYAFTLNADGEIARRGRKARHYWETYLNRENWKQLMTEAVAKKVAEMRCASR